MNSTRSFQTNVLIQTVKRLACIFLHAMSPNKYRKDIGGGSSSATYNGPRRPVSNLVQICRGSKLRSVLADCFYCKYRINPTNGLNHLLQAHLTAAAAAARNRPSLKKTLGFPRKGLLD